MNIPTRALFGAGELNNLHKQVLPGKKALLVISNGRSTRANGYLERVVEQLAKAEWNMSVRPGGSQSFSGNGHGRWSYSERARL